MELRSATLAVLALLPVYLIAGLALQHAAYILQYGSVFDAFRRWLERTACAPGAQMLIP